MTAPAEIVAMVAVAIKFVIDAFEKVGLPAWAKVLMSVVLAGGFAVGAKLDLVAIAAGVDPSPAGYAMTAIMLAALASKVVHPAVEVAREWTREKDA